MIFSENILLSLSVYLPRHSLTKLEYICDRVQLQENYEKNVKRDLIEKEEYRKSVYSGYSAQVSFEYIFDERVKDGKCVEILCDKIIKNYINGLEEGERLTYSYLEILKSREFFINGKKEGKHIFYDFEGKLYREINYSKDMRNGECKIYDSDGSIKETKNYVNDYEEGISTSYDRDGCLTLTTYKQGVPNGEYIKYYDNGNKKEIGYRTYDTITGNHKRFYENGNLQISTTLSYIPDRIGSYDGEYLEYWENGNIKIKTSYVNGQVNGELLEYDENGELRYQGVYILDICITD